MSILDQIKGYEKTIKHLTANAWDYLCTCKVVITRVTSGQEMVEQSVDKILENIGHY